MAEKCASDLESVLLLWLVVLVLGGTVNKNDLAVLEQATAKDILNAVSRPCGEPMASSQELVAARGEAFWYIPSPNEWVETLTMSL